MEKLLAALAVLPFGIGFSIDAESLPDDEVVFSFADPEIVESSGLVVQDGLFATVNDSGDGGRVFTVDPADGETVAETSWEGSPEDVEALATLPDGDALVGDIGDNLGQRASLELVRVPFGEDGEVTPTTYELVYPDEPRDAESLLVHPDTGQVLVAAKEFVGRLYAAPEELDPDGPNELELLGEVLPIATDGAFFPDGDHFVLRSYGGATFYRWPSLEEVGEIDLPAQPQGEGIAVDDDGTVFVSTEGQFTDVLRIALPRTLQAELDGTGSTASARPGGPSGGSDGRVPDEAAPDVTRAFWPWVIGGVIGAVIIVVLLRSLRRP
ncbi:hypothetical protein [Nocardioides antri]|uniref:WD40 repeat domain-containing protein n=1 Tax=Nocardioides antri TaxID=2607659 RepID=A0A5B1M7F9_9ACTN|nr:hypothetical protein [Nocardioides antri]KAA1428446.1 hypothetical protein F0U47_05880 [Nocardioides antri]